MDRPKITIIKTPVISVGNLTVGGTGKTPVVDFLVREFQNNNLKPAVLSRGYGRKTPYSIKRLRFSEGKKIDPSLFTTNIPITLSLEEPSIIPRTPMVFLPVGLTSSSLNRIDLPLWVAKIIS